METKEDRNELQDFILTVHEEIVSEEHGVRIEDLYQNVPKNYTAVALPDMQISFFNSFYKLSRLQHVSFKGVVVLDEISAHYIVAL